MIPTNTPFDRVDILLKTFLRDGLLFRCIDSILKNMQGARLIVVDDGYHSKEKRERYARLEHDGHVIIMCPFDTGYGAKMNIGQKRIEREFTLRIADDFLFDEHAANGVLTMVQALDNVPDLAIASGRVNNQPYEADMTFEGEPGNLKVTLTRALQDPNDALLFCDLTVNYSLIRRSFLKPFVWDERYKIGGDHADIYLHAQALGVRVAYVVGANVNTMKERPGEVDRTYGFYRGRARLSLPWTFERHGWASMVLMDGRVDTRESVQAWADAYDQVPPSSSASSSGSRNDAILAARAERRARNKARVPYVSKGAAPQPAPSGLYGIRHGYRHRDSVPHFDDFSTEGQWQVEVYDAAARLFYANELRSVLDFGCGNGEKLLRFFSDCPCFAGMEVEPTLSKLRERFPEYPWVGTQHHGQYDLVICSDVIEHVQDPQALLRSILSHEPSFLVISTPDRDIVQGPGSLGPPTNKHHVREWNMPEFRDFLQNAVPGAKVAQHYISNQEQGTQVAVLTF